VIAGGEARIDRATGGAAGGGAAAREPQAASRSGNQPAHRSQDLGEAAGRRRATRPRWRSRRPAASAAISIGRILVGVLGVDVLALGKVDVQLERGDAHARGAPGDQVHADPPLVDVDRGAVGEVVEIEGPAQLAVDAPEEVQVEARGDAARVVVGGVQQARVLAQIAPMSTPSPGRGSGAHRRGSRPPPGG
jgi:hypothetical protein